MKPYLVAAWLAALDAVGYFTGVVTEWLLGATIVGSIIVVTLDLVMRARRRIARH